MGCLGNLTRQYTWSLPGTPTARERCSVNISHYYFDDDEISELNILERMLFILSTLCPLPQLLQAFPQKETSSGRPLLIILFKIAPLLQKATSSFCFLFLPSTQHHVTHSLLLIYFVPCLSPPTRWSDPPEQGYLTVLFTAVCSGHCIPQHLAHSRCSISVAWINERRQCHSNAPCSPSKPHPLPRLLALTCRFVTHQKQQKEKDPQTLGAGWGVGGGWGRG